MVVEVAFLILAITSVVIVFQVIRLSARAYLQRRPDAEIDQLIKPPKQLWNDFDPSARDRTQARREHANAVRHQAARLDCSPDEPEDAA